MKRRSFETDKGYQVSCSSVYHHVSSEGNLHQLLIILSESDDTVKSWLKANHFTSHQVVSEIITFAGQTGGLPLFCLITMLVQHDQKC